MIPRLKHGWIAGALALGGPAALALVPTGPAQNLTPKITYQKVAPRISPDGGLIVFTDYTGAVDGSGTSRNIAYKQRADADFQIAKWKMWEKQDEWGVAGPDDKNIWFHSFSQPNGRTDIWKYNVITGESTQMTNHTAYDAFPAVSPDGTKLVFLSQRETSWYQLYLMDATKPENATDNVPQKAIGFTTATNTTVGRAVFTPDSKKVVFLYRGPGMARQEIYIADAADTDNDGQLDNMRQVTDMGAYKAGTVVGEPAVAGDRIFFTANAALDGTGKNHVYSVDLNGTTPNADIWQVSASTANENYVSAGADGMVVLAGTDTSRGAYAQYVDYYPMGGGDTNVGSVSGLLPMSPQGSHAGYIVEAFNGPSKIAETTTDANGAWSIPDLRPGGYFLRFSPPAGHPVPISTVTRPVIVPPGQNAVVDVFSSGFTARRPFGVVPTLRADGSVDIRFQPAAESSNTAGWTYVQFNVYRGTSADGPWTKIATVSKDGPTYSYKDTTPGDLTKAFYSVTSVTTNGTETLESWYADAGQAANNLIFNPGFELTDADGKPLGYSFRQGTDGDATWGLTASDAMQGSNSLVVTQGATPIDTFVDTSVPYNVPAPGAESYIHGAYARFIDMPVAAGQTVRQATSYTEPNAGATVWYDASYNSNATNSSSANLPTTPPTWLYQVNPITTYNPSTYTRVTLYGNKPAAGVIAGTSRAVYDDFTFQVKRVGDTGVVWGRILDAAGSAVSGVTVTDGTKTVRSDTNGVFTIRDSATGDHTVTLSYPGQPNITRQIKNIGGYVFSEVLAFPNVIPVTYGGRVLLANGQPAKGATVTWVSGNLVTDTSEEVYKATTDANGYYTLDTSAQPLNPAKKVWATAHLAGYKGAYVSNQSITGAGAGVVGFDLTLGQPTPVIEVGKAAAPPAIDGVVNPSEWAGSADITKFVKFPTDTAYSPSTRAYALWDENNLYVAMVADEPSPEGIKADQSGYETPGSPGIWGDDNFQIFLDPKTSLGIGHGREAWQLGVNLNPDAAVTDGVFSIGPDAFALNTSVNAYIQADSTVDTAGKKWMAEMAIPWYNLSQNLMFVEPPAVGDEWGGMFARYRSQDATNASTSSMAAKFAEPWNWNTLRFVNTVSPPTLSAADALKIAGGLTAATSKAGDANSDGKITLTDALLLLRQQGQ